MDRKQDISRRDVLKAVLVTGGTLTVWPFLKACARLSAPTAPALPYGTASPVKEEPSAALRGLDIDRFFRESYRQWMRRDPENLTTLGLADLWDAGDDRLTDISDDYIRETQSLESNTLQFLRHYDRSALSDSQALTADVYDWFLDDLVRGHPFMYDDYPLNPVI